MCQLSLWLFEHVHREVDYTGDINSLCTDTGALYYLIMLMPTTHWLQLGDECYGAYLWGAGASSAAGCLPLQEKGRRGFWFLWSVSPNFDGHRVDLEAWPEGGLSVGSTVFGFGGHFFLPWGGNRDEVTNGERAAAADVAEAYLAIWTRKKSSLWIAL